jgi:hypothetical protein
MRLNEEIRGQFTDIECQENEMGPQPTRSAGSTHEITDAVSLKSETYKKLTLFENTRTSDFKKMIILESFQCSSI